MKRRLAIVMSIVLVFALVLAGCGNGNNEGTGTTDTPGTSTGGNSASKQAEKVQVRLATWAGTDEANELQNIIDDLNAKSDVYQIVQDSNPAEYDTRMITQLSGNSGPDLFWVSAQRAAQFAAQGAMLDITDRLEAFDHPAAQIGRLL